MHIKLTDTFYIESKTIVLIQLGSYPKSVISVREGAATSRSSDRSPQ